jgi:hypothetical protein
MVFDMGFSPGGGLRGNNATTRAKAHLHFIPNAALEGPLFHVGVDSIDVFQAIGLSGHEIERRGQRVFPIVPRTLAKCHTFNNKFTVVWSQNTVITVWTSPSSGFHT